MMYMINKREVRNDLVRDQSKKKKEETERNHEYEKIAFLIPT